MPPVFKQTHWYDTLDWKPQLDNPTFLGWLVVAAYLIAALLCARAAWRERNHSNQNTSAAPIWAFLAAALLFLGINKQLNFQTLLIAIGRYFAGTGELHAKRRLIQLIFAVVFTFAALIFLRLFYSYARVFLKQNRLASAGVVILFFFVVFRAASINHVFEQMGITWEDNQVTWVLEFAGSFCLALAASKFKR